MTDSGPSAKIICDSISDQGHRLTTMEVKMHRFILAEMNTHRVFSRNSASSRAIPYHKIRNRILEDPCYPLHWGAEQKGMQSGDAIDEAKRRVCRSVWDNSRSSAIERADVLHELGLHKSLINRLLEPFMWHTAIITSTEWANFFNQRCHPDAMPEMKAVADAMQLAYYESTPALLGQTEWHLPYIEIEDREIVASGTMGASDPYALTEALKRVSVARCARVSYLTHDGKRDWKEDLNLCNNKLFVSNHWSPFEHVAKPASIGDEHNPRVCGNFMGWAQFRKTFGKENQTQFEPNLPQLAHERTKEA